MNNEQEREIARIVMAATADEAAESELRTLNELLATQPEIANLVVELMSQEAWLNWHSTVARSGEIRGELLEHITNVVRFAEEPLDETEAIKLLSTSSCQISEPLNSRPASRFFFNNYRAVSALAASLLLAVGVLLGLLISKATNNADSLGTLADNTVQTPLESNYVARFVHGTACLWNQETNVPVTSDALRTGESLSLLEGLAELQLDWDTGGAALRIEGPAGLVLTAERGASLSHGRFTADIEALGSQFSLSTPNGLIEVSGDTSLGVAISGSDVELHVFKGSARFVGPWTRSIAESSPVTIAAGEAIRIGADKDGRTQVERDVASPSSFASKVSMGSDHLAVSPEYVQTIVAGKPLVYWRFEDAEADRVANEMGPRYTGHLQGEADRVRQIGNTSLELGAGLTELALQSFIYTDDALEGDFPKGYAVEAWFKPSHYHWGSVISFLGDPAQPGWQAPHGLIIEIGGPRLSASEIEHPGKLRYVHRNPPGSDFASGTSLFSGEVYELRRWQHIVAVKSDSEMRLYNNGVLVASGNDSTGLAPGMKIVLGQLDRAQFYRKFIGQIDEFAVYPRPLSEEEVKGHFQLLRPSWNKHSFPKRPQQTVDGKRDKNHAFNM
jgi:hypothetical protein